MANKNVFEGSDLEIRTRLREASKSDEGAATLILKIDDVEQPPVEMSVRRNWAEHRHTFSEVPFDKDNYRVEYEVQHDGETYVGADDYTVWPTWVDVKLTDDVTRAPAPNTAFKLEFEGGETSSFRTGESGRVRCKVKYKALLRGLLDTPTLTFLRWSGPTQHGRSREAFVELPEYAASLVSPAWKGQSIEQFVNLSSGNQGATLGHDQKGRRIAFNLKLVDKRSPGNVINPPNGQPIYVKVELADRAGRNADLADLEGVNEKGSTAAALSGKLATANGAASFTLVLGRGGLERYKVRIGTTPACEDVTVKLTSMRKLWVGSVGRAACPDISKAVAAFRKVGITLEKEADLLMTDNQLGRAIVRAADSPHSSDRFIVGSHNLSEVTAAWAPLHAPLTAFLVWADHQYDAATGDSPLCRSLSTDISKTEKITWPPTGAKVYGAKVDAFETVERDAHKCTIFRNSLCDGDASLRNASALVLGSGQNGAALDVGANLYIDPKKSIRHVWVKVPDDLIPIIENGRLVRVAFDVHYAKGPYLGWASNGGVVIALRGQSTSAAMSTIVHEIGHRLNQLSDRSAGVSISRREQHKLQYNERGHSGWHCAEGISSKVFSSGADLTGLNGSCVMFGESVTFTKYDFCAKCTPFVLAELVDKV